MSKFKTFLIENKNQNINYNFFFIPLSTFSAKYLEQLQNFMTELDECYHGTVGDMENHASTLWKDLQRENK